MSEFVSQPFNSKVRNALTDFLKEAWLTHLVRDYSVALDILYQADPTYRHPALGNVHHFAKLQGFFAVREDVVVNPVLTNRAQTVLRLCKVDTFDGSVLPRSYTNMASTFDHFGTIVPLAPYLHLQVVRAVHLLAVERELGWEPSPLD